VIYAGRGNLSFFQGDCLAALLRNAALAMTYHHFAKLTV
jgi:hypothetical protein